MAEWARLGWLPSRICSQARALTWSEAIESLALMARHRAFGYVRDLAY